MKINSPSHLSDTQLEAEVMRLARCERGATVQLIAHLMEFDTRQLYLGAGFSSLFVYCCEVLRLSEHETYNRIEVARVARRFPLILDLLADGSLNQTTVRFLAPHLTAANCAEVLAAASHKSKREVEELLARMFPRPAVPSSVRKLPTPKPAAPLPTSAPAQLAPLPEVSPEPEPVAGLPALLPAGPRSVPGALPLARRSVVSPLAPDRYEIRFTASAETREKLLLAQDLLRHAIPTGDPAAIIDRALTLLLEDLARKKFAATDRPRSSSGPAAGSRHVAARVLRGEALLRASAWRKRGHGQGAARTVRKPRRIAYSFRNENSTAGNAATSRDETAAQSWLSSHGVTAVVMNAKIEKQHQSWLARRPVP